ncbi:hypothetical protein [Alicycliphilus denitrificans]|uniref:hypothetical protein n=1 Tax=Alicycliphilus denitrificans TaxID=179636 RepID=UPI003A7FADEC
MGQTSFAPPAPAMAPVEISGSSAPLDTRGESLRLDVTRWMPPGRAGSLGFSLGLMLPTQADLRPYTTAVAPWSSDVGLRWRAPLGSGHHLDMAVWARTARPTQEADAMGMIWHREQGSYGTRLEVQWTTSRTRGLVPEFGAIGVQLQGDSRLLLRARGGGPMLYYRTKF